MKHRVHILKDEMMARVFNKHERNMYKQEKMVCSNNNFAKKNEDSPSPVGLSSVSKSEVRSLQVNKDSNINYY